MKIIYIGPFQLPDKNAAAHRVLNNAKILRKLGHEVLFLGVSEEKVMSHEGFTISNELCSSSREKILKLSRLKKLKNLINQNSDVKAIIAYDYYSLGLLSLKRLCKKKKIRLVVDTDEWFGFAGINFTDKLIRCVDSFFRMRVLQPKTDGVIAIGKYLFDFYCRKTNSILVPPLVDYAEEKWGKSDRIKNEKEIVFTYAGSPRKKDRLNLFVEALCDLNKEFLFYIIGITKEQYLRLYPQHEDMINSMQEKVQFLGRISHKESLEYLKNSSFSVFVREPNRANTAGFPTKFVEAVSCGVPVITNLTSDLSDYLYHMENGIVIESCSSEDVKKAIEKALSMTDEELLQMKENCENNKMMFHYENYLDEMKKLFGEQ